MLGRLIAATVIRPVTTTMATIAVVLFGWVAATRLPIDLLPDLSYPSITVQTRYLDAAPIEVEELVTRPVEELVGAVPGVIRVESTSREGTSEVVLDFSWGTHIDRALADVREKLDRIVLPTAAERPVVLRYDPSQEPIMRLALAIADDTSSADLSQLRYQADRTVKRALEKVAGIAAVRLHGGDDDEVIVELDPTRLAALGVTTDEVVAAIQRDNINRPGGALTEQRSRYLVRTVHESRTPEQLASTIVRSYNGAELHVRDLAKVSRAPIEREELAFVDGREADELAIYREGDANTVMVSQGVLAELERLRMNSGLEVRVLANQADFISSAVDEVVSNTIVGGTLAVLVLLFFLRNLRATLGIALAIPISLLATFIPLHMLGVSLNLMSLGGLALGVGMLVDNGIVVLESIARIRDSAGPATLDRRTTAVQGATEVAAAVVASTLTTVAVFLPMAFVEGVAGQLVHDLSLAVSFSILSSMIVSLTLVPVLESWGTARNEAVTEVPRSSISWILVMPLALMWRSIQAIVRMAGRTLELLSRPVTRAYARLEHGYPGLLRACLRRPGTVLGVSAMLCAGSVVLARDLGRSLLPDIQQGEFFVQLVMPQGTSIERTSEIARLLSLAVADDPRVVSTFARVGSVTQSQSAAGALLGTHLAQVNVRLQHVPPQHMSDTENELLEELRATLPMREGTLTFARPALFSFDAPIEVHVFSDRPDRSVDHAKRILPELDTIHGLTDVVPDELAGRPEVRVHFDRERLVRLGIGIDAAALAVQRAIQGEVATRLHAADRQLDVRVRLPRVDRSHVQDIERIQIGVKDGVPVSLVSVARVDPAIGPAEIRRIDGRRGLRIRGRLVGGDLGGVAALVEHVLDAYANDDPEVVAIVSGQAEEMQRSLRSLGFVALLSVFLVYVVMASTFENLLHPFLIMFTVPMAIAGVALACVFTDTPLSAMVGIGAVILTGIVVNNAIVLIDAINHRRGLGLDVHEAIVVSGELRVRPILMTTMTTVLGLLPMSLGLGEAAALRQPLAISVVGGLGLSTLLTLVVIPCTYLLMPGRRRDAWAGRSRA